MRAQIGALIVATSAIQLANGFFGTFISLRVAIETFDAALIGPVLSSYFAGLTLGAWRCGQIIERVGYIRAYAAFAGLVAAATASMPLWVSPVPWIVLRVIIGFGCAGIFVTTESWLNAKARSDERGRVFSVYMVGTFLALAVGQLLIGRIPIETSSPFNVIVALFAVALVLVSTARAEPPQVTAADQLPFRPLLRLAAVGLAGCALSGLITGAFYALVPAWMQGEGISRESIALSMLAAVLGGLAFQVPIGQLSDRLDRRSVLIALGIGFAAAAIALVLLPHTLPVVLPATALLGGFMSTLYPVCVAYVHDRTPADRVVAVSGRLILVSGVGSVIGPLAGAGLMARFGIDGVLYFLAAAAVVLSLVAGVGRQIAATPVHLRRTFGILTPQAAALAHDPLGGVEVSPPAAFVDRWADSQELQG